MKLYCLSGNPTRPCFVLKFKSTTIMLDCGLDMTSVLKFLPLTLVHNARLASLPVFMPRDCNDIQLEGELRDCSGRVFVDGVPEFCLPEMNLINFSEIDVILISNYLCMMALPYITEHTNFRGVVYATEPTVQIGKLFMEEISNFIERTPRNRMATRWKQPEVLKLLSPVFSDAFKPQFWRHWFNAKDLHNSLSKVQTVGFMEKRSIFGAVTVTSVSSGYCLGSCNWIISSTYETIAYISESSTLTTHPKPMDWIPLKKADVLIWCGLTQTPLHNPDSMLSEFCATVATTVRNGGNVLIPCYPSGVIYDLFECLSGHLDSQGLMLVPMYFVSPVADISLACSNIYAEWLSQTKQSKVYFPEEPFPHALLVRNNRLKPFPNLHTEAFNSEFRCPCIVFAGHPSLRFGDAVHFIELWGSSHSNTVVFTEPDFPYLDALAPFQPLAMKAVYCPIDTSQNFTQANKQIRDLKPQHLVVPEQYIMPPAMNPSRSDLVIEYDNKPITFNRGDVLSLPVKRKYERMEFLPELAESLMPLELKPGIAVSCVSGCLSVKDNKYILKPIDEMQSVQSSSRRARVKMSLKHPSSYTWGTVDVDKFVLKLSQAGILDVKVEERQSDYIIHLQNDDTIIQVEDRATHIMCNSDEQLRRTLKDILLQCLNKF